MTQTNHECYTGTGPAAEVVGAEAGNTMLLAVLGMPYEMAMSDELSRRQFYARAQQATHQLAELLAQRDELARLLKEYVERDEMTRITNSVLYADASAAISRIKGA